MRRFSRKPKNEAEFTRFGHSFYLIKETGHWLVVVKAYSMEALEHSQMVECVSRRGGSQLANRWYTNTTMHLSKRILHLGTVHERRWKKHVRRCNTQQTKTYQKKSTEIWWIRTGQWLEAGGNLGGWGVWSKRGSEKPNPKRFSRDSPWDGCRSSSLLENRTNCPQRRSRLILS